MNQEHARPRYKNNARHGVQHAEAGMPLQRVSKQLEDFSQLNEIQEVLSPYWAARSDTAGRRSSR